MSTRGIHRAVPLSVCPPAPRGCEPTLLAAPPGARSARVAPARSAPQLFPARQRGFWQPAERSAESLLPITAGGRHWRGENYTSARGNFCLQIKRLAPFGWRLSLSRARPQPGWAHGGLLGCCPQPGLGTGGGAPAALPPPSSAGSCGLALLRQTADTSAETSN